MRNQYNMPRGILVKVYDLAVPDSVTHTLFSVTGSVVYWYSKLLASLLPSTLTVHSPVLGPSPATMLRGLVSGGTGSPCLLSGKPDPISFCLSPSAVSVT